MSMLIVFTTAQGAESEALAEAIVEAGLAACVQVLPPMVSVYVWEGSVQKETENLLLIKTLPENYDALESFIIEKHSYDIPEIVAVEVERASGPYLDWLTSTLR